MFLPTRQEYGLLARNRRIFRSGYYWLVFNAIRFVVNLRGLLVRSLLSHVLTLYAPYCCYNSRIRNFAGSGLEPRATRSRHESCGALQDVIPPSIRLNEPTTLNKERVGQSSEARKCGNQSASGGSSWEPYPGLVAGSGYAEDI